MSQLVNHSRYVTASDADVESHAGSTMRRSTIRPMPPPKPSHLHSISVRSTTHEGIPSTFLFPTTAPFTGTQADVDMPGTQRWKSDTATTRGNVTAIKGVQVQLVKKGLVRQRLGQLKGDGGFESEAAKAEWEKEREAWREERQRKKALNAQAATSPVDAGLQVTSVAREHSKLDVPTSSDVGGEDNETGSHWRDASNGGGGGSTLKVPKPRSRKTSARAMDKFFKMHSSPSKLKDAHFSNTQQDQPDVVTTADRQGTVKQKTGRVAVLAANMLQAGLHSNFTLDDKGTCKPSVIVTSTSGEDDVSREADVNTKTVPSSQSRRLSTLNFLTCPLPAIALHSFTPAAALVGFESATRELAFEEDDKLEIMVEDVGGGWSLGRRVSKSSSSNDDVGLIPRDWYEFLEDAISHQIPEFESTPSSSFRTGYYASSPLASVLPPDMLNELEARATPPSSFTHPTIFPFTTNLVEPTSSSDNKSDRQPSRLSQRIDVATTTCDKSEANSSPPLQPVISTREESDTKVNTIPTPPQPPQEAVAPSFAGTSEDVTRKPNTIPPPPPPPPSSSESCTTKPNTIPIPPPPPPLSSSGDSTTKTNTIPIPPPPPVSTTPIVSKSPTVPSPNVETKTRPAEATEPQGPAVSVLASEAMWRCRVEKGKQPSGSSGRGGKASVTNKSSRPVHRRNTRSFSWRPLGAWESTGAKSFVLDGPPILTTNVETEEEDEENHWIDEDETKSKLSPTILTNSPASTTSGSTFLTDEKFEVEVGPSWKVKVPFYAVQVHSPVTRFDEKRREHTVFAVTTTYWTEEGSSAELGVEDGMTRVTVERRYSQFDRLAQILSARYSGLVLPPLPEKQYAGRFGATFLETRRRGLERYLTRLVRHPLLRHSAPLTAFLSITSDVDHETLVSGWSHSPPVPEQFWAKVWHPDWNVERESAAVEVARFTRFAKSIEVGGGVVEVEHAIGRVRSTMKDLCDQMQDLSKSILRLSSGISVPLDSSNSGSRRHDSASEYEDSDDDGDYDPPDALAAQRKRARAAAVQTTDGAWCWREGCYDCLALTKAIQSTGIAIAQVGDLYQKNAEHGLAPVQELLKEFTQPLKQYKGILDLHRATCSNANLNKLEEEEEEKGQEDGIGSRRDTVLNVTMSEIERFHSDRAEDFCDFAETFLDQQMELHCHAYEQMKRGRSNFFESTYADLAISGPREANSEELALLHSASVDQHASDRSGTTSRFSMLNWGGGGGGSSDIDVNGGGGVNGTVVAGGGGLSYAGSVASTILGRPLAGVASSVVGLRDLFSDRG